MEGVLIFFAVLALLLYLIRILAQKIFERNDSTNSAIQPKINEIKSKIIDINDDEELVAAISAAAFIALNKKIKVKKISFIHDNDNSAWSRAGRLNIMSSHSVQHR